ncbi:MAG: DUF2569 domain-containing protein [Acidobacteriia bacterium]|nr:DUF2569 domain-containing protein [Terriglobia bacterium]
MFFICTLVFFGPAAEIWSFVRGYHHFMETVLHVPHPYSARAYYFAEKLVVFAIRAYGILTGIQLWKIRPGAVERAKRFLTIYFAYALVDYLMGIIWLALMTPEGLRHLALSNFLSGNAYRAPLSATGYAAIWYAYLSKSARVRSTFFENAQGGEIPTPKAPSAATM